MLSIGERLREARKAAGLTQRQLADKIKVSNTSISNWEKGVSMPDPDTIQYLCWALEVQPNFFFSVDESISKSKVENLNIVRIAGRDGSYQEKILNDEQLAAIKAIIAQLPDAPDDI